MLKADSDTNIESAFRKYKKNHNLDTEGKMGRHLILCTPDIAFLALYFSRE